MRLGQNLTMFLQPLRRRHFRVALIPAIALFPTLALAWGQDGHEAVAALAQQRLTPTAGAEVRRLLSLEGKATLPSISTWADAHRSPSTSRWHYVNLPEGSCRYSEARDCPDGQCVVAAIERQTERLRTAKSDADRLLALKYVAHLVADIHQPLHAGREDDKGGNLHQVQAFGRGTNLHSLWDSGLIEHRPGGVAKLLADVQGLPAPPTAAWPADWAEESCAVTLRSGFYPSTRNVGTPYAGQWDAVMRQRLSDASYRLAGILNDALTR
jgi:nuclease S1